MFQQKQNSTMQKLSVYDMWLKLICAALVQWKLCNVSAIVE